MEAVLGLSMTPTSMGWVLVDGNDADGPTLARDELAVERHGAAEDSGRAAEQATTAALRLQTMIEEQGQRLRGIGVTWSDDAAADAALVLESLTEAGFDNVVPVRFPVAAESLTDGADPIDGAEQAAVCVIEAGVATLVLMDGGDEADGDDAPTVERRKVAGDDALADWLAGVFGPGHRRPVGLVLAGGTASDGLAVRLERELALPVFVRTGAQLGLARGAAQALAPGAGLETVAESAGVPLEPIDDGVIDSSVTPKTWTLPYAGALTMLVVGVLTLVVSSSAAVSMELTPSAGKQTAQRTERIADAPKPAAPVTHAVKPAAVAAPSTAAEVPAADQLDAEPEAGQEPLSAPVQDVPDVPDAPAPADADEPAEQQTP